MAAAALLDRNPRPTDGDIDTAMNGNLCRCATYFRIHSAIHKAASSTTAARATAPDAASPLKTADR
jgi:isoquinoline 1-oxidoreductase alpha subunit